MGPRRVFVDTGAWYALQVSDDEWHAAAVGGLRELVATRHPLVTSNQVIGETYTLLRFMCGHAAAVAFLDRLDESRRVERIFVGKEQLEYACVGRRCAWPALGALSALSLREPTSNPG